MQIHQFSLKSAKHQVFQQKELVGAIALSDSGGIIASMASGFSWIDLEKGMKVLLSSPESHLPNNRFNDGKCDPAGRFWSGTMDVLDAPHAGNLYLLNSDLRVEKKISGVSCSNGLAWSLDHKTMYFIDSPLRCVKSYAFDVESGAISDERVAINLGAEPGVPDGMTIDSEGMVLIAFFGGWRVGRYDPTIGKHLESLFLPVANVTSCTFGGEDLQDLYVTSAKAVLNESDLEKQPLAGSLFVFKNVSPGGLPATKFRSDKAFGN
ncbi:UNVERIFIED_CONTAM: hypothetical protein GTU68_038075 [Idotea baltica]|nr:hypothetical protein [Idotea baltica]